MERSKGLQRKTENVFWCVRKSEPCQTRTLDPLRKQQLSGFSKTLCHENNSRFPLVSPQTHLTSNLALSTQKLLGSKLNVFPRNSNYAPPAHPSLILMQGPTTQTKLASMKKTSTCTHAGFHDKQAMHTKLLP